MLDKRVPPVIGRIDGHPPRHRADPGDPAIRRRDADRAAEIRAEADRRHVGGDSGAGPAARASCGHVEIERVARQPENAVGGVHVMRELRRVRLADQDGTCGPQPLDRDDVLLGDEMLVDLRPERRPQILRVQDVLDDEGDALERTRILAACQTPVARIRLRQRVRVYGADRIDRWVQRVELASETDRRPRGRYPPAGPRRRRSRRRTSHGVRGASISPFGRVT